MKKRRRMYADVTLLSLLFPFTREERKREKKRPMKGEEKGGCDREVNGRKGTKGPMEEGW